MIVPSTRALTRRPRRKAALLARLAWRAFKVGVAWGLVFYCLWHFLVEKGVR